MSLEEVEELFNDRQEQVRQEVSDWRVGFEERLVEIHKAGAEGTMSGAVVGNLEGAGTEAEPIVKVKGSTDTTKDLSPNVRFLLRADTIFEEDPPDENNSFHPVGRATKRAPAIPPLEYYPDIISPNRMFFEQPIWPSPPAKDVSVEKYHRYTEAEKIVKRMLADIQMPDVARMELDAMKARFVCGRCTERKPRVWDNLVQHYMEQRKQWEKNSTRTGAHPTRHPVTFRNIHDVEWTINPKPLVRILTVEEASQMNVVPTVLPDWVECRLCSGTGRCHIRSLDDVRVHLQDVHDVASPIEGLHYQKDRSMSPVSPVSDVIGD
ncbi:hypothetical protein BDV93DRAFT_527883, partial [Ceratobasidium sp. AG-I]